MMGILKKAFIVWHEGMIGSFSEGGPGFSEITDIPSILADSPAEAKAQASLCYDYQINGREVKWTDLRVKRKIGSDLILYKGREIRRDEYNSLLQREKLLTNTTKKLEDSEASEFYLQTGIVGNCLYFWAQDGRGYTCHLERAHLFSKEEAIKQAKSMKGFERFWEKEAIETASSLQVDHQRLRNQISIP